MPITENDIKTKYAYFLRFYNGKKFQEEHKITELVVTNEITFEGLTKKFGEQSWETDGKTKTMHISIILTAKKELNVPDEKL